MRFLLLCSLFFSTVAMAETNRTDKLADAIEQNNFKKAKSAVLAGADVNGRDHYNTPASSLFLRAVKLNRVKIVELLLKHNADVNQTRGIDLYSGLLISAKYGHSAMAKILIENDADVNHKTNAFRTALHVAALHNSISVVEELIKVDHIDANISNIGGLCALAVAARQNREEIAQLLKDRSNQKCIARAIELAEYNDHGNIINILKK